MPLYISQIKNLSNQKDKLTNKKELILRLFKNLLIILIYNNLLSFLFIFLSNKIFY